MMMLILLTVLTIIVPTLSSSDIQYIKYSPPTFLFAINTRQIECTIVGSNTIRYNLPYRVAISVHNSTEPATIRLRIATGDVHRYAQEVTVQPWTTEYVTFDFTGVPSPTPGGIIYELVAEGLGNLHSFRNETKLKHVARRFKILAFTDKFIYNPGDLVRFRCLILDEFTRPVNLNDSLDIVIGFVNGMSVQEWVNQSTTHGVYSGEFRVSESLDLDYYQITFRSQNISATRLFQVVEPEPEIPFEVFIETASGVLYNSTTIRASIHGQNKLGAPIHGVATVLLGPHYDCLNRSSEVRTVIVNPKGTVEFSFNDSSPFREISALEMTVSLVEDVTGHRVDSSTSIDVHQKTYIIQRVSNLPEYSEGKLFELDLRVTRFDNSALPYNTIELWFTSDLQIESETFTQAYQLDTAGIANAKIMLPSNMGGFFVMAKYDNQTESMGYYAECHPTILADTFYVTNSQSHKKLSVGSTISLSVFSKLPLHNLTYEVITLGNVLQTETIQLTNSTQPEYIITFEATLSMLPEVYVLVFTFRDDGSMDVASCSVPLRPDFSKNLMLESSQNRTQPGAKIGLTITTQPNSYVGLFAIEKSILMQRNNDLFAITIYDELETLNFPEDFTPFGIEYQNYSYERYNYLVRHHGIEKRIRKQRTFCVSDIDYIHRAKSAVTWLWETWQIDQAVQNFTKIAPTQLTTWLLSAFSLHPEYGLAFNPLDSAASLIVSV